MAYILNTPQDQEAMLAAIGATSLEDLFAMVPRELRLGRDLDLPPALSEMELWHHARRLAATNRSCQELVCFLGAGAYDHFVPAVVDQLAGRGEFYTSYTPYQAEASQGNLQAFFEYQTLIARLTGMDVSNASLYDGATSAAEAVLMALAATGRRRIVVAESLHPEYRQVLATYLAHLDAELETLATPAGNLRPEDLARAADERVACVLVQHPNFLGILEEMPALGRVAHQNGALFIAAVDPISLGLLKRPADYGADIVVAEGQALGNPLNYGGPYLGIMACREPLMRRLPGRIAGQTTDRLGRTCYVLTLQTREQHIRRERATSNICTNQGLLALRAAIYLAVLGPQGLRETAALCLYKSRFLARRLIEAGGGRLELAFGQPTFKEFVLRDRNGRVQELIDRCLAHGYLAGLPLGRWYPQWPDGWLLAVTEQRTAAEMEGLCACVARA
jgi:glycine dehydrogenase subunit 1